MVLRSGAKIGPAGRWDWAGAVAGVLAVLVLAIFVVKEGTRDGYSHIDDTISQLGASGTPGAWWFFLVNVAGAVLIIVFAYGAHRRLPVGLATGAFLGAVALGALLIGAFPCSGECLPGTRNAHNFAAAITAVMIFAVLASAAWALPRRTGWFKVITVVCAVLNLVLLVLLGLRASDSDGIGLLERLFWASAYVWVLVASWAIIKPPRLRRETSPFDPVLVQRKLLRSASKDTHSAYGLYSINDRDGAKRWLLAAIDPAAGPVRPDDEEKGVGSVTLAFTCAGLRALGVNYRGNGPFAEGMKARAVGLGDVGESDPQHWQATWRRADLHLLVWVEAEDEATRDALLQHVEDLDASGALSRIGTEYATSILNADGKPLDHRGFRDGVSQPWVLLKVPDAKARDEASTVPAQNSQQRKGGGTLDPSGEWRPLAVGEFVLGEPDESNDVSPVPAPSEVFHRGSFLVVRKLAQGIDALDAFMKEESARLDVDDLEERLLGRRRDGRLLNQPVGAAELNEFTFGDDADGLVCPLGAHIRRAHPRDALGFGMLLSARHRIIRRGNTYSDDDAAPAGWKKGLMFIAVNSRIEDQFEFIQRLWLNDGDRQRLGASRDLIAGSSESASRAIVQLDGRTLLTAPHPVFVRTMGGEYFFAPSMAGLWKLTM